MSVNFSSSINLVKNFINNQIQNFNSLPLKQKNAVIILTATVGAVALSVLLKMTFQAVYNHINGRVTLEPEQDEIPLIHLQNLNEDDGAGVGLTPPSSPTQLRANEKVLNSIRTILRTSNKNETSKKFSIKDIDTQDIETALQEMVNAKEIGSFYFAFSGNKEGNVSFTAFYTKEQRDAMSVKLGFPSPKK